ncbi:ABC transporter substrate-binding protein [Rhodococcus maanshanensis]|uniref:ABC transporter substrate-binding protein n=1 Tax=Rhodococcus maanshanensis TaxID=183556 RepID=UPI0022B49C2A|nr:ABC transporter substrate-binding protein [Rhodococcus maanshanensis]MCZ4556249.1 ABC transporter substrate-binding protein [Rhodococcus maanshanensis]
MASPTPKRRSTQPRPLRALAALAALLTIGSLVGACAGSSETEQTADGKSVLRYQGAAGQVTFPELAADLGYFQDIELKWVGDTISGPQDIQSVATGQTEFGSAFNGAIVKLRSAGSQITSVVSSYGADQGTFTGYFVLDGGPITGARDLIGKKVGMNTLGAHHEFVVREWLAKQGLTPDEIKQVELIVVPPINTEQALREGQIDVAALGSVFRETAVGRGGLRPLFTDSAIFGDFSYGTYVLRDDFIAENPEAAKDFTQGVARAVRWTQTTPRDQVVARFKEIIGERGRNENTSLTDYWRSPGIPVAGAVIADRELQTWIDWLVRNGELKPGELTAADLFTNEFNPYANGAYTATSGADGQALGAGK